MVFKYTVYKQSRKHVNRSYFRQDLSMSRPALTPNSAVSRVHEGKPIKVRAKLICTILHAAAPMQIRICGRVNKIYSRTTATFLRPYRMSRHYHSHKYSASATMLLNIWWRKCAERASLLHLNHGFQKCFADWDIRAAHSCRCCYDDAFTILCLCHIVHVVSIWDSQEAQE